MTLSVTAYHNLHIAPYQLVSLQHVRITKQINEHTRLYFTAIVPEEGKDDYIKMTEAQTKVEVSHLDEKGKKILLFTGMILNLAIKMVRDIYYMEVEAVSHTYNLDIKRKSRSFQDANMKYTELLKEVTSVYSGADVVDMVSKGALLKKFTMQYEETDWQFLKRMASRFHTGLIPAAVFDKPKFSFGVPEGEYKGKIDNFHYRVRKKIADFRSFSENDPKKIEERDFVYYEVETDTVLDIGNEVDFKGKRLFVCEAHTQMENGLLKHQYVLCSKEGMSQKTMYHEGIVGLTLEGKVIDVAADTVKVHLEIDKKQGVEKAYWFPYSSMYTAEGHSGWYCMPELHDSVHLYFPSHKEEEGVAINSIRKDAKVTGENKLGNPNHKYFRTADGKEIRLSPDEIVITAKDGETFIRLHEKEGIEVYSKKNIQIISDDTITMSAQKKMILSAKGEISITCQESKIKMDGTTTITGKKLKTN